MTRYKIMLHSVQDVKDFVHLTNSFPYDFDLLSGRYVVDGKSIVGIFSLDLGNPIEVLIYTSNPSIDLIDGIKKFLVKPEQS